MPNGWRLSKANSDVTALAVTGRYHSSLRESRPLRSACGSSAIMSRRRCRGWFSTIDRRIGGVGTVKASQSGIVRGQRAASLATRALAMVSFGGTSSRAWSNRVRETFNAGLTFALAGQRHRAKQKTGPNGNQWHQPKILTIGFPIRLIFWSTWRSVRAGRRNVTVRKS